MKSTITESKEYKTFIKTIKERINKSQIKAAISVNRELLSLYWDMGKDIVEKQENTKWGDGFLNQLSNDLQKEFPEIKGFSKRNLELIRKWYIFWIEESSIAKQLVSQIPWGHNIVIMNKIKNHSEALFYVKKTIENNWSRSVLTHQIETGLFEREGNSINNFKAVLPEPHSDLAMQTIKDPYNFDFLTISEKHNEKELEGALVDQVAKLLLELGTGFAFISRQHKLNIDEDEFYIDLLLYHVQLHCYVVVELKSTKFKPEFVGKLNFYVSAVDDIIKGERDNPTIGILICKSKNKTIVEYTLRDIFKPIGISEYIISKNLPDEYKSSLPSIEEIETELEKLK